MTNYCGASDDWWDYDNSYAPDPCQGLSGPACAQKDRSPVTTSLYSNNPKTGPFRGCDAGCQAKRWLTHIKKLSHLGRTTITFTVGAVADTSAALSSVASSVVSSLVALAAVELAHVITGDPGNSGQTDSPTGGFTRLAPPGYSLDGNGNYVKDGDGTVYCGQGNTGGCIPITDPSHPLYIDNSGSLNIGLLRELYVSKLIGGTVARDEKGRDIPPVVPGEGRTGLDVVGPNGEYIFVGGANKASNPAEF